LAKLWLAELATSSFLTVWLCWQSVWQT
jgi:hypothetical protein